MFMSYDFDSIHYDDLNIHLINLEYSQWKEC